MQELTQHITTCLCICRPDTCRLSDSYMMNSSIERVEWWPALVRCEDSEIDKYIRDETSFEKYKEFIERFVYN